MVTNASINPGDEVFNSYDACLPNSKLLCHYGFLLEGNSNDVVNCPLTEVDSILGVEASRFVRALPETLDTVNNYSPNPFLEPMRTKTGYMTPFPYIFGVNAEGALTTPLFALLLISAAAEQCCHEVSDDILVRACKDACVVLFATGHVLDERFWRKPPPGLGHARRQHARSVLRTVCIWVERLCTTKIAGIGPKTPDVLENDWGDILDATPLTDTRTRMAITHAISERSLLESCTSLWREVSTELQLGPADVPRTWGCGDGRALSDRNEQARHL